jgi:hypothetical protein
MSIVRKLTQEDVGKKIIYCIFCAEIDKKYGEIVDFNDDVVFCKMRGSNKIVECTYEDLDFDLDMDEFCKDNSFETGFVDLMDRFAKNMHKRKPMKPKSKPKRRNRVSKNHK